MMQKLVMDCSIINADIRRVAILLLEAVEKSFLRESENGAYIEPGSVLRFTGTRHVLHDSHNFVVTDPVVFVAFPFVELTSSKNIHRSRERDDLYPRTLLQNLYGFDVVTSRGKNQVIHKMPVGSQSNDTLFVNQLWCLMIGSDILITMSDRPADDLLGDTIEKRTDYFRQPLRIEIVDINGVQYNMSISSKTPWVDFFRHVIYTVHGNLISIMDYELVDQTDETVTTERWVELSKATRLSLLKFYLVERKTPTSRSSSVSSRRSSRSGIKRLLLLDHTHRNNRHSSKTSVSRYHADRYEEDSNSFEEDSSSSERIVVSKRAPTPGRPRYLRSSANVQWHDQPAKTKDQQSGAQAEYFSKTDIPSFYPQSSPTIITLDSNDEDSSESKKTSPSLRNSEGAIEEVDVSLNSVTQPPEHQQLPSSDGVDEDIRLAGPLSMHGHYLMHEQQALTSGIGGKVKKATGLEDEYFYLDAGDNNETSKKVGPDGPMVKDTTSSANIAGTQISNDGLNEYKESSVGHSDAPATIYRKVQVEDVSESSDEHEIPRRAYPRTTGVTFPDTSIELNLDDKPVLRSPQILHEFGSRGRSPEKRFIFRNNTSFSRDDSYERFRSRSSSLSNSTDESFHSRGRSRIRRRPARRWESLGVAHESSSRPGVRFQPQERQSSNRDSAEMSPYGSSNATKVEALPTRTAVPFFFWKPNSVTSTFSSHDTPEQVLIKLLDQIDERISGDPISRYYSKVPELTMDDVLLRQESLHESGLEKDLRGIVPDESSQVNKFSGHGTIDIRTGNIFTFRSTEDRAETMNKGGDKNNIESVEALNTDLDNDQATKAKVPGEDSKLDLGNAPNSINASPGRSALGQTDFSQTQALGLISHDKTLAKQLVEMSQQIIWSFIPDTGGSLIHTVLKRLWGCVDIMCLVSNPLTLTLHIANADAISSMIATTLGREPTRTRL